MDSHDEHCDCNHRPRWHESLFSPEGFMVIFIAGIALALIIAAVRS